MSPPPASGAECPRNGIFDMVVGKKTSELDVIDMNSKRGLYASLVKTTLSGGQDR